MTPDEERPRGAPEGSARSDAYYGSDPEPFQPRARKPRLQRVLPVSARLRGYPRRSLRKDVISGITVAALAVPSGMAYAELAGLSPVAGLYCLLLPALAYAAFGTSRQLIVGPEGAIALLVGTSIAPLAASASDAALLAAMTALLVGGIFLLARVLRLGWIADYFSLAVLVGYLHGVAIVLIVGQLEKLTGISVDASDPLPQIAELVGELGDIDGLTLAIGAVSLAALLVLRRVSPKVPAALIVVIIGIGYSAAADLAAQGVAVVGDIPPGLPSILWPGVGVRDLLALLPVALGIFAVTFADGILTARSFAGRHGQQVDANQELIALGSANLAAGISQGFPVGASGSRTAVNDQMQGRTQLVGVIAAAFVALVLLVLTAPVAKLPTACLGAVIVAAAIGLIEPRAWRNLARAGRSQVVIAATTVVGVVVFGVLEALVVAVLLSIIDVVSRRAQPRDAVLGWVDRLDRYGNVSLHPRAKITPGVVVYRLDGSLFFANASYFKGRVHEAIGGAASPTRFVVLQAESLNGIDASGGEALTELVESLARSDIGFVVARLTGGIRERFDTMRLTDVIGAENFFPTVPAAVRACVARMAADPEPDAT